MNRKYILLITTFLIVFSACKKIVLGSEESNDPINNFELFWDTIDKHSGIIFPKKINWDSVYTEYRPQVNAQTTDIELWQILSEMIEIFDDEHTVLFDGDKAYASGAHRIADAKASFSKSLIQKKYLESFTEFDIEKLAPDFSFGKIKSKNIGYIYLGDTDGNNPDVLIDSVLQVIGNQEAIIFDLRNNGGGIGFFGDPICNVFADEDKVVYTTQTRNGPEYNDYDSKTEFGLSTDVKTQFLKPLIVLTDARTVSAAESMTVLLKAANPKVTHLGDTTAGAFSTLSSRRFLPNGWTYRYPVQMSQLLDGTYLDGKGQAPDVLSKNTPQNITNHVDIVIEDAIRYLKDVYEIE